MSNPTVPSRPSCLAGMVCLLLLASPGNTGLAGAKGRAMPGDDAFARMEYGLASAVYDSLLSVDSTRAEVLWRLARLEVCLGDTASEDDRIRFYENAERFARRSIDADSTVSEGHSWRAAALGSLAMHGGARRKVQLAREIKRELDLAIMYNPEDDVAHSILGSFYRALGTVSWLERQLANVFLGGIPAGGFEEGEKEFEIAISIAPNALRHHFELGLLYVEWGRPEKALKEFARVAELQPQMASDFSRVERAHMWVERLRREK